MPGITDLERGRDAAVQLASMRPRLNAGDHTRKHFTHSTRTIPASMRPRLNAGDHMGLSSVTVPVTGLQ